MSGSPRGLDDLSLRGRRVLVTGASKGIGAATARLVGTLGADVVVHCNADREGAARVAEAIADVPSRVEIVSGDLARWDDALKVFERAARLLGGVDGLVLNHGIWKRAPIGELTEADYDATLDANLRGVFALCGAFVRHCDARPREGGQERSIVLIASTAAQRGEADHSHYAASKGAIVSLTKSLATELAPRAIRVNCVAPGWVHTGMTSATLDDPRAGAEARAKIPMGRVADADEIAWAVAFLLGKACRFANGEIFNVNGGAVLSG
ncbi:MAG: SDR family NAD(P)-dependent oxidoreductase [Polyangiales bacterium]